MKLNRKLLSAQINHINLNITQFIKTGEHMHKFIILRVTNFNINILMIPRVNDSFIVTR